MLRKERDSERNPKNESLCLCQHIDSWHTLTSTQFRVTKSTDLEGPELKKLGRPTSSANETTVPEGPKFQRMLLLDGASSAAFFS